jgi:DNA-binding NarL/FixJ family response regulator
MNPGGKLTCKRLKENYPDVRILITSGFQQSGEIGTLMDLGAKGFIQKPHNQLELVKAVAEAIGC